MYDQARNGNLSHAILFFGNEYVGKKTYALELARIRESKKTGEHRTVLADTFIVDGHASGIDHIRTIKEWVNKKPINGIGQTVIIDNAHELSHQAVNALLKTLEDPREGSVIILITHDSELIPETIRSRVHTYHFAPVSSDAIQTMLEKKYGISKQDAMVYAQKSFGLPGLAWRMACDPVFQATEKIVGQFLDSNTSPSQKKNTIATIIEDEKFDMSMFLRTCMIILAQQRATTSIPPSLWRYMINLTRQSQQYNLSNKIQLTALLNQINNIVPRSAF
jgi:hypothetical protein